MTADDIDQQPIRRGSQHQWTQRDGVFSRDSRTL